MQKMKLGAGAYNLREQQGVWRSSEKDKVDENFQTCLIGGQVMIVINIGNRRPNYRLTYMNVNLDGFRTMVAAKDQAPAFSLRVLKLISESAAKLEPVWIPLEDHTQKLPHEDEHQRG